MTQKGFAPVLIIVFIAAVGFLGYFSYKNYLTKKDVNPIPQINNNTATASPAASPESTPVGQTNLYTDISGRFTFSYPKDWKIVPSVPEEFKYRDYSGRQDWKDFFNSPEGLSWWLEGKMFAGECRGPVLQNTLDPRQIIAVEIVSADGDGGWCWSTGYFKEDHKWLIQDKYMYPIKEDNSGKLVTADWKGDYFKYANIAKNDKWLVAGGLANRETYNLLGEAAFAQIIASFKFK
jgi:hypothetical protein